MTKPQKEQIGMIVAFLLCVLASRMAYAEEEMMIAAILFVLGFLCFCAAVHSVIKNG